MKTYILLGILLMVGLSFARTEENWMGYSEARYSCSLFYDAYGYHSSTTGLMRIVYDYDNSSSCAYWNCGAMEEDLGSIGGVLWNEGGMWDNGCYEELDPSGFRSNMIEYSIYATDFKSKFLAGLRAYLAENPGDRSNLLSDLQDTTANYRYCLTDIDYCYNDR